MAIKKLEVSNFKSFKELDLELGNFNVVVGANASGKSNFVSIFGFIRDIANEGLNNAFSMQGAEYASNIGTKSPQVISLKIFESPKDKIGLPTGGDLYGIIKEVIYDFKITVTSDRKRFNVQQDKLTLKLNYRPFKTSKKKSYKAKKRNGKLIIRNEKGKIRLRLHKPPGVKGKATDLFPPFLRQGVPKKTLLLKISPFFFPPPIARGFREIAIYDFDPKHSKKAVPVTGKSELEEDGKNLSLVLKNIIEDDNKKRKFTNLLKDILPFFNDLAAERLADKSLLFKLQESYFPKKYFPASFISDGTVNISSILTALYFEKKPVTIIEEPERNVHPHLISKMMDMMKDASKNKQIIVTTHSPEVVKHAGLENLLLVSRNKEGFSTISRPSEKKEVKIFLQNELGVEDLYVQNLLGD